MSLLFSAPEMHDPLLGVYALCAEWHALIDPATDPSVAAAKLGWWHDEVHRLFDGKPVHPITRYLGQLPTPPALAPAPSRVRFGALATTLAAVAGTLSNPTVERTSERDAQAAALRAEPLMLAAALAGLADTGGLRESATALAVGLELAETLATYRRAARGGRVLFALEELRAAGVDPAELAAAAPSGPLAAYLERVRGRAAESLRQSAAALPRPLRASQRHLLVLAALAGKHLYDRAAAGAAMRTRDLFTAWSTARRAARRH